MPNVVRAWANDATSRGPSTRLWGRYAQPKIGPVWTDANLGWGVGDDFNEIYASGNRYTLVEGDAGASFGGLATEIGGVARLITGATDNNEVYMSAGVDAGAVKMDLNSGRVWFETRVRTNSIVDDAAGLFVGLAEEGWAAANALVDDTAALVTTKDHIGFSILQADGDAVRAVHSQAAAATAAIAAVHVPVADTWVKLGLYFDGVKTCSWWVDGVPHATTVLESAPNFPDGEELHFALGCKTGGAVSLIVDCDWWYLAQEAV